MGMFRDSLPAVIPVENIEVPYDFTYQLIFEVKDEGGAPNPGMVSTNMGWEPCYEYWPTLRTPASHLEIKLVPEALLSFEVPKDFTKPGYARFGIPERELYTDGDMLTLMLTRAPMPCLHEPKRIVHPDMSNAWSFGVYFNGLFRRWNRGITPEWNMRMPENHNIYLTDTAPLRPKPTPIGSDVSWDYEGMVV